MRKLIWTEREMAPGGVLFFIFNSIPSAKESKYLRKHVFTAREMGPGAAGSLFSHFQTNSKSWYNQNTCGNTCGCFHSKRDGSWWGPRLLLSLSQLWGFSRPAQVYPNTKKARIWGMNIEKPPLLSISFVFTKRDGDTVVSFQFSCLSSEQAPDQLIGIHSVTVYQICSCQEIWLEDLNWKDFHQRFADVVFSDAKNLLVQQGILVSQSP